MRLLALDGGLDETGWAVFDVATLVRPMSLQVAREHFVATGTWYTASRETLPRRLMLTSQRLRQLCQDHGPIATVALEHTPFGVTFRDRRAETGANEAKQAMSLQLHAMADGCLAGTILSALVPAPRLLLRAPVGGLLRDARTHRAIIPTIGRTSEHARAAIALGLQLLTEWRPVLAEPEMLSA